MDALDIVGLGACGWDYIAKVSSFADEHTKVTADSVDRFAGGVTANNLVQAARLGLRVAWCGALGKDGLGKEALEEFAKEKVAAHAVRLEQTQFCWIAVDIRGERQIYAFPNATAQLSAAMVEKRFAAVIRQAKHFHTAIAVIPLAAAIAGAKIAKAAGVKVFVDVDGDIDELTAQPYFGSREEALELVALADVVKLSAGAAKSAHLTLNGLLKTAQVVAVTKGKDGCIIADRSEEIVCPPLIVPCVDGTGAGDAFMGGLSYGLLQGWPLQKVGSFANACGAFCCQSVGARASGSLAQVSRLVR